MFRKIVVTVFLVLALVSAKESSAGPGAGALCCAAVCLIEAEFPPLLLLCTTTCVGTLGASFPSLGLCTGLFTCPVLPLTPMSSPFSGGFNSAPQSNSGRVSITSALGDMFGGNSSAFSSHMSIANAVNGNGQLQSIRQTPTGNEVLTDASKITKADIEEAIRQAITKRH